MQQSLLGGKDALPRYTTEILCPATAEISYNVHMGKKAMPILLQSDFCG